MQSSEFYFDPFRLPGHAPGMLKTAIPMPTGGIPHRHFDRQRGRDRPHGRQQSGRRPRHSLRETVLVAHVLKASLIRLPLPTGG
jgi:hypothetical protein